MISKGGSKMIDHLVLRIYPSKKHILVVTKTTNKDKFRNVEPLINANYEFLDTAVEKIHEQIREYISSNNAFCLVNDKETDAIFIYEFELNANCTFQIAGYDEEGIPYLELLN